MPYIGCHVSAAGGIENVPVRGKDLGCDAIQVFTSNQMQWKGRPISTESCKQFIDGLKDVGIRKVVTHDSYLINLGSPDPVKLEKSRQAFIEEIQRSTYLEIPYIIFHPGSHMGEGEKIALETIARSLDYSIESTPDSEVMLLLENTAGQGSNVGYRFEHLREIIDYSKYPERLGVCYDTCHGFSAGYDMVSDEAYESTFKTFDDIVGLEKLQAFHLNDGKRELGSRIDRHECLGKGKIGWEPFFRLVNDRRFSELPMILETPGGDENFAFEIAELKKSVVSRNDS